MLSGARNNQSEPCAFSKNLKLKEKCGIIDLAGQEGYSYDDCRSQNEKGIVKYPYYADDLLKANLSFMILNEKTGGPYTRI